MTDDQAQETPGAPADPDEERAWELAEEFDRRAREPGGSPDAALLAEIADMAPDDVLLALLDAHGALCEDDDTGAALRYGEHLTALADLLGPNGSRGVRAAVDVHVAGLHLRAGDSEEAWRRAYRCGPDLADVLPALLGEREWVLGALADAAGRPEEARRHALAARDLFAEHDRLPEAAGAAAAAASTHAQAGREAFDDWRHAVELHTAAGDPTGARECAEQACVLLLQGLTELPDNGTAAQLCGEARDLALSHDLREAAARLGLALAFLAGESDEPWPALAARHERCRHELEALGLDPAAHRLDLARVDLSLGRAALLRQRVDDAREALSAALPVLREADLADEAQLCEGMLTAVDVAQGRAAPAADGFTDPGVRNGLRLAEAVRLAGEGRAGEALALLDDLAVDTAGDPHQSLAVEAAAAAVRRSTGDDTQTAAVLARIDAQLAAADAVPPMLRTLLVRIAEQLRDGRPGAGPAAADPADPADLADPAAAAAQLRAQAPGTPGRGERAAALVAALISTDPMGDPALLRPLDGLMEIARQEIAGGSIDPPPGWARTYTAGRALALLRALLDDEVTDLEAATAQLDGLAAEAVGDPAVTPVLDLARLAVDLARAVRDGDAGAQARFAAAMQQWSAGPLGDDPRVRPIHDALAAMSGVLTAAQHDGDVPAALDDLRRASEQIAPGSPRAAFDEAADRMSALYAGVSDGARPTDEQVAALLADLDDASSHNPDQALHHGWAAAVLLHGGTELDLQRVDTAVVHLRRAVELGTPADPQHVFHRSGLALGLMRRAELTNATGDLREARTVLEEARDLAGGPAHPLWQMVNGMLTDVRRLLGDGPDPHRPAVDGLRRHLWHVLVQPDLASATRAAREAGADALDVARTCLIANDPATAITALDAGRGLALFAATQIGTVAERLTALGDAELARQWRDAAAAHAPELIPADLRRRVLEALSAGGALAGLLDPPELGDIQQALTTLDADALVYLMPGDDRYPGFAVAAPATGPPAYLALPNLKIRGDHDVERYLDSQARRSAVAVERDLGPANPGNADRALAASLDAVCRWAWKAAVGPVVESYLPRLRQPAPDRPPRVVLVPIGDLARIPWQAARRPDDRYAVELVAVSQAASARMLCRSAELPPVPPSPTGLLVGDPDTRDPRTGTAAEELAAARLEVYGVRQSFHGGARYVGRRPDGSTSPSGPGDARAVREWLTTSGPAAGGLLHLACHGVVETGGDRPTAHLLLAAGERLAADELIALMGRAPDRDVGLVVLAACRTGVTLTGYDEAYSLGTAFLAGGARTVLSTQWSVPDRATSALMYVFHHLLHTRGLPAWAALREAQLWMLDENRVFPDMPGPLRQALDPARFRDVTAWAGFVHWGQ